MIERTLLFFNFGNIFILIFLNVSDIEVKEDSDINKLKNFNNVVYNHLAQSITSRIFSDIATS